MENLNRLKKSQVFPGVSTQQFDDIDTFAEAIQPLNVRIDQLTSGKFLGDVNVADCGRVKFTCINPNQALRMIGERSDDRLLFMMALRADKTPVISDGFPISTRDIFGFNSGGKIDLMTGKNPQIIATEIDSKLFQSIADTIGFDSRSRNFFRQDCIRLEPIFSRVMRGYCRQVCEILKSQPALFMRENMRHLIADDFCHFLVDALKYSAQKKYWQVKKYRRFHLIKRVEEIADMYRQEPLNLQQICDRLETSSSALSYGFKEIFGMSPMAYLKIQRLNGVRRALKNADPDQKTVMQLAYEWGFGSLGHFSRDYQKMFGELPSETLKRLV